MALSNQYDLYAAVKENKYSQVKKYLLADIDPNTATPPGEDDILLVACTNNATKIVAALLKAGMNPNGLNEEKNPLLLCCEKGFYDIVVLLVQYGANIYHMNKETGHTPFSTAAYFGHDDLIHFLDIKGANALLTTYDGVFPFEYEKSTDISLKQSSAGQWWFRKEAENLGYKNLSSAYCYGHAIAAISTLLNDELNLFERVSRFNQRQKKIFYSQLDKIDLKTEIKHALEKRKAIKTKISASVSLLADEKIDEYIAEIENIEKSQIDLLARETKEKNIIEKLTDDEMIEKEYNHFLYYEMMSYVDIVYCAHNIFFRFLLDKITHAQNFEELKSFIMSRNLEKQGDILTHYLTRYDTLGELTHFLIKIKQHILDCHLEHTIAILISKFINKNDGHIIDIGFDPKEKLWIIWDANKFGMRFIKNETLLAEIIKIQLNDNLGKEIADDEKTHYEFCFMTTLYPLLNKKFRTFDNTHASQFKQAIYQIENDIEFIRDQNHLKLDIDSYSISSLLNAVMGNDVATVEKLILNTVSIDYDEFSYCLELAITQGYHEISKLLLAKTQSKKGMLSAIAHFQDEEDVRQFLQYGFNPNETFTYGNVSLVPFLIFAAQFANPTIVQMFIDAGANVNCNHENTLTPLIAATKSKKFDNAKILLKNNANPHQQVEFYYSALYQTVVKQNLDFLNELLKYSIDVNQMYFDQPHSVFYESILRGNIDIVKKLVEHGANIDREEKIFPLQVAIEANNTPLALYLVMLYQNHFLLQKHFQSCFNLAIEKENVDVVKALLSLALEDDDVIMNVEMDPPLLQAVKKTSNNPLVSLLLKNPKKYNKINIEIVDEAIECAVSENKKQIVTVLIAAKKEILLRNNNNDSTSNKNVDCLQLSYELSQRVEYGDIAPIVDGIIKHNTDMHSYDELIDDSLIVAIRRMHTPNVKILLQYYKQVPFHIFISAIRYGNDAIVKLIIEKGVSIEKQLDTQEIFNLIKNYKLSILKLLLEHDYLKVFCIDDNQLGLLFAFAQTDLLELLLDKIDIKQIEVNSVKLTTIALTRSLYDLAFKLSFYLNESGKKEVLSKLIDHKQIKNIQWFLTNLAINLNDTKPSSHSFLYESINCKTAEITKLLLDHGAMLNHDEYLLHKSVTHNDAATLEVLCQYTFQLDESDPISSLTPLALAANCGSLALVKILVQAGANIHFVQNGKTALYFAIDSGNVELVEFFIKAGANMYAPPGQTLSPLAYAVKEKREDIVKAFLEANYNPNDTINSESLLSYAIAQKNLTIAEYLIDAKATLFSSEKTAHQQLLYLAAKEGKNALVRKLLQQGLDPNIGLNDLNLNPLLIAAKNGLVNVVILLIKHGAYENQSLKSINDQNDVEAIRKTIRSATCEYKQQHLKERVLREIKISTQPSAFLSFNRKQAVISNDDKQCVLQLKK